MEAGLKDKRQGKKRVVDIVLDRFADLQTKDFSDYELVDVQYVKEGSHRYLRVFIDKDGGVDSDDCSRVSRDLEQYLDSVDPIREAYILEVSSPGIERPLKTLEHFERFKGKLAELKLYTPIDGLKLYEGIILGVEQGFVIIEQKSKEAAVRIPFDKIASARLKFVFE